MLEDKLTYLCKLWIWDCSTFLFFFYVYLSAESFLSMFEESPLSPFWILLGGWAISYYKSWKCPFLTFLAFIAVQNSWGTLWLECYRKIRSCRIMIAAGLGASCAGCALLCLVAEPMVSSPDLLVWHILYIAPGCIALTGLPHYSAQRSGLEPCLQSSWWVWGIHYPLNKFLSLFIMPMITS